MAGELHTASLRLSRRLSARDRSLGISAARLSALSLLVARGPMRVGDLADAEGVEPPTMTRLLDALGRDALVMRAPDPADRRATLVRATPAGVRSLRRDRARRVGALARDLRTLDPRDLATLAAGIDVLRAAIERTT